MNDIRIEGFANEIIEDITRGLARGSAFVKDASKKKCPVKTGRLKSSIDVTVIDEKKFRIGSDVYYAFHQHEANPNGKAFFLRNALYENLNTIVDMIEQETKK